MKSNYDLNLELTNAMNTDHTHQYYPTPDYYISWKGTATTINSLANLQYTTPCPVPCSPCKNDIETYKACKKQQSCCEEKKDTTMNIEREKISYLSGRIYDIENKMYVNLQRKFGLIDDDRPSNGKELVARITAGKYTLEEKFNKYEGTLAGIRWRDPAVKEDQDGYTAAEIAFQKTAQPVKDAINILPADQALKMLQDFEATTLAN